MRKTILITSFGYKYPEIPKADIVFDARCIANPHDVGDMKTLTGKDKIVVDWLKARPSFQRAYEDIGLELAKLGKEPSLQPVLSVAIGCYGGRHRSVALVEYIAEQLTTDFDIKIVHRELERYA